MGRARERGIRKKVEPDPSAGTRNVGSPSRDPSDFSFVSENRFCSPHLALLLGSRAFSRRVPLGNGGNGGVRLELFGLFVVVGARRGSG